MPDSTTVHYTYRDTRQGKSERLDVKLIGELGVRIECGDSTFRAQATCPPGRPLDGLIAALVSMRDELRARGVE